MFGTYNRLGLHVGASDLVVIRALWKRLNADGQSRAQRVARRRLYSLILQEHAKARRLYVQVMRGYHVSQSV